MPPRVYRDRDGEVWIDPLRTGRVVHLTPALCGAIDGKWLLVTLASIEAEFGLTEITPDVPDQAAHVSGVSDGLYTVEVPGYPGSTIYIREDVMGAMTAENASGIHLPHAPQAAFAAVDAYKKWVAAS